MERFLIARHAESEYSARGALNGDPSIVVSLTEEGREQARTLGEALAGEPIGVCAVTEFARTRETAELALAGRGVPLLVVPELNDHPAGKFEGGPLADYLEWAHAAGPDEVVPGGSETRAAVIERFARGFRVLVDRPEDVVLTVLHSLPIAYLLGAAEGGDPASRMEMLPYAEARLLSADEAKRAVEHLERWHAARQPSPKGVMEPQTAARRQERR
jgi:broad specificity phosphatase PhoE